MYDDDDQRPTTATSGAASSSRSWKSPLRPRPRGPRRQPQQDLRGGTPVDRTQRVSRRHPQGRVHGDHGAERIGQVHAHAHHGGPRHADHRPGVAGGYRDHRPRRHRADGAASRGVVSCSRRSTWCRRSMSRQHPAAVELRRAHARAGAARVDRRTDRHSGAAATACAHRPHELSGGRRQPRRHRACARITTRSRCSPTSRPATWTRAPDARCSRCSLPPAGSTARSIAMVTHDPSLPARRSHAVPGRRPRRRRPPAPECRAGFQRWCCAAEVAA